MNETSLDVLTQRLDRLERENRRLKRTRALVLVVVGALTLMGQTAPSNKVIEAERFVLRDGMGKMRAELALDSAGGSRLYFFDEPGKPRVALLWDKVGGPRLDFIDENGGRRSSLQEGLLAVGDVDGPGAPLDLLLRNWVLRNGLTGALREGEASPLALLGASKDSARLQLSSKEAVVTTLDVGAKGSSLTFHDEEPLPRATLGWDSGETQLSLSSSKHEGSAARLSLADNGSAHFSIVRFAGLPTDPPTPGPFRGSAELHVEASGNPSLAISGPDYGKRAMLGLSDRGYPFLALFDEGRQADKNRQARMALFVGQNDAPMLELYDQDKKLRTSLGLGGDGSPRLRLLDKDGKDMGAVSAGGTGVSGRPWVLWAQFADHAIAISGWTTRPECEAERIRREKRTTPGKNPMLLSCLPDTVDPRSRP